MAEDLEGTTTSINNLNDEIAHRKSSEAEVRKLTRQIEFILGATKAGLDIVDSEFNIRYVDPARRKIYGDPAGRKCYEYFRGRSEVCSDCGAVKAFATKEMVVLEESSRRENNRFVQVTNVPFQEADGEWLVAAFNVDISELKQAEERQSELMRKLAAGNEELKEFAYVVSHDLKAPLRGIKTIAGWLTDDYADKLGDGGKEQLRLLSSRVDRMHNLIDGVLQYSRIGRVKEREVCIDLNELVSETVDMVAAPSNITVTIENNLPEIVCERTRITQVFQNLISNAVKFIDKPQSWVKIRCEDKEDLWEFSVADNGPGIEEQHFEKIFKIFQTLQSRDSYESTGVGLTLVKKIVELYGGAIWVQSKVGEGSTFYFTLPKSKAEVHNIMTLASTC
jgi:signal transduction histidine kinase